MRSLRSRIDKVEEKLLDTKKEKAPVEFVVIYIDGPDAKEREKKAIEDY